MRSSSLEFAERQGKSWGDRKASANVGLRDVSGVSFDGCRSKSMTPDVGQEASLRIQELRIQHFYKADPAYGRRIANGPGLNIQAITGKKQATAAD